MPRSFFPIGSRAFFAKTLRSVEDFTLLFACLDLRSYATDQQPMLLSGRKLLAPIAFSHPPIPSMGREQKRPRRSLGSLYWCVRSGA